MQHRAQNFCWWSQVQACACRVRGGVVIVTKLSLGAMVY